MWVFLGDHEAHPLGKNALQWHYKPSQKPVGGEGVIGNTVPLLP